LKRRGIKKDESSEYEDEKYNNNKKFKNNNKKSKDFSDYEVSCEEDETLNVIKNDKNKK